jgi:ubiquinone/menaquinone biosynthesis C-methylase UbiE
MKNKIEEAISANIAVHSAMANDYNTIEPHFRPESIKRVEDIVKNLVATHPIEKALDLGCGTGFMINILKKYTKEIIGVDVTQAMMDKVDKSGNSKIELINSDTGTVALPKEHFDIATAYTFLDHLYDMKPTIQNAYNALKSGGIFYADLSPNFYFWKAIKELDKDKSYDPIIQREVNAVWKKDEEIEQQFGVKKEIFTMAEHQKHTKGGLVEEELKQILTDAGFTKIEFIYHWFIGQAQLINDESVDKEKRFEQAEVMHHYLTKSLPASRNLFKYIGFIATK